MGPISTRVEPSTDSELLSAALRFARRVHLGQYRKQTYEQFVEHPIGVAQLLSEQGHDGPLLVAAYLHDVVEKTEVEIGEIRERFGPEVAAVVASLSEDPSIEGYAERKRELRRRVIEGGEGAMLIYTADRLSNMRDWRTIEPGEREACAGRLDTTLAERLELWAEDVVELRAEDPELPFLAEIETELEALRREAT